MRPSFSRSLLIILVFVIRCLSAAAQIPSEPTPTISGQLSGAIAPGQAQLVPVARLEGLEFVNGSGSQIVLERDGKRYLIDTKSQTIREFVTYGRSHRRKPRRRQLKRLQRHRNTGESRSRKRNQKPITPRTSFSGICRRAMHLPKKALMIDFTHRFTFDEAFEPGAVSDLFGLDGFSISSLGLYLRNHRPVLRRHLSHANDFRKNHSTFRGCSTLARESGSSVFKHVPCRRRRNRSLPKQIHHEFGDRISSKHQESCSDLFLPNGVV